MAENMEASKEITQDEILMNEQDILKGLLEAAEDKEDESSYVRIEVARKGKVYFSFRVRPLSEEEYNECREKATTYVRNQRFGGIKFLDYL